MSTNVAKAETQELQAVPEVSGNVAIMQIIERAASDPNVNVDKMERLFSMYEHVSERNAEQAFTEALVAAQTEMRPVSADAENPQTHSKYASYVALDGALRPIYSAHGFALSFGQGEKAAENCVEVLCHVGHVQGHTRTYRVEMPADGKGAKGGDVMTRTHATGAAFTYGMRYLLKLIFNVAVGEFDNDGNAPRSMDFITDEQAMNLEALAEEVGAKKPAFLKYFKVPSFGEIPACRLAQATAALEKKRTAS